MATPDPFEVLGIPPDLDLDADRLEERYLALSRECHPDYHTGGDPAELLAALQQSARVNDAYEELRNRWSRARLLCDRLDASAFEDHKQLDPAFLMEAMEVAEEVAEAGDEARPELERRIRAALEDLFARVALALEQGDAAAAATRLHESKYYRKALADLGAGVPR